MSDDRLPDELQIVERLLFERDVGAPSTDLRRRIQQSIRRSEPVTVRDSSVLSARGWNVFVALAASVAVWANLSSALLNQPVGISARAAVVDIDRQAEVVNSLMPELSHADARRVAARLSAGIRWSTPRLQPSPMQAAVQ
jgi:hypothetical protein